jgi:hypothetical protein
VAISVSVIGLPFNSIAVKLNVERSISNVQRSTRILAMVTGLRHRKREKPGRNTTWPFGRNSPIESTGALSISPSVLELV